MRTPLHKVQTQKSLSTKRQKITYDKFQAANLWLSRACPREASSRRARDSRAYHKRVGRCSRAHRQWTHTLMVMCRVWDAPGISNARVLSVRQFKIMSFRNQYTAHANIHSRTYRARITSTPHGMVFCILHSFLHMDVQWSTENWIERSAPASRTVRPLGWKCLWAYFPYVYKHTHTLCVGECLCANSLIYNGVNIYCRK